ncbi:MAG: hypothetical protein J0L92_24440 [Deltaproteobacteria bacterium]|nr:hypothetical protein [Deltaproteobacteria bacterium]
MSDEHEESHQPAIRDGKPLPDDSPPQNTLIFVYAMLAVASLVGLKFVFDSFLESSRRETRAGHLEESRSSEALAEHRDEVREALEGGEMPIDRAITQLAERGRGAFPQVRPYASGDRGAREGWNRRAPAQAPLTPEPDEATGGSTR